MQIWTTTNSLILLHHINIAYPHVYYADTRHLTIPSQSVTIPDWRDSLTKTTFTVTRPKELLTLLSKQVEQDFNTCCELQNLEQQLQVDSDTAIFTLSSSNNSEKTELHRQRFMPTRGPYSNSKGLMQVCDELKIPYDKQAVLHDYNTAAFPLFEEVVQHLSPEELGEKFGYDYFRFWNIDLKISLKKVV